MNDFKESLGDWISAGYALTTPLRKPAGCRVLMYHAVGGDVAGDYQGLYSVAPARFSAHMRSLSELFSANVIAYDAGIASGDGIAITFDDGYRDNLTAAAPALASTKLPFTVFVTPGFVISGAPQYLSPLELKELARFPGTTIGAHGNTHRRLTECSDAELKDELSDSKTWLEDLLGQAVTTMSYPHGAVDSRVSAAAKAAGYMAAAGSRFGTHRKGDNLMQVPRTDIWASDDQARFIAKVRGDWDWMRWLS